MIKRLALWLVIAALCVPLPALCEGAPDDLTARALECFLQSAFGAEYGGTPRLTRWQSPLAIYITGAYTPEDLTALDDHLTALREAVPGLPRAERVTARETANVVITFAPQDSLCEVVDNYVEGWGFATWWYDRYVIGRAQIAVASDSTTQEERRHIILEELVNALGLGCDLENAPDSVISQAWTGLTCLSELDILMLNHLYDPRVAPGMTRHEALTALTRESINR